MSIPKIIHCGIFGGWKLTEKEQRCVDSWKRVLPDYEIRTWTDFNGPTSSKFFRDACLLRPVNSSNYIRLWAVHEFGGVYLDNDVEALRPFDLEQRAFIGWQRDGNPQDAINTAVLGSEAGHPLMLRMMRRLEEMNYDVWPVWAACAMPQAELVRLGMKGLNLEQKIGHGPAEITVYEKSRFYPWFHDEKPFPVGESTFAIHHWGSNWDPSLWHG